MECTGTYGAGLLRYLQKAGVTVLEVTAPDKHDRRKRGKDDTIDAENDAHAALAQVRTVTPKTRDGMVESLRVLKACRKTAIAARRVALQLIQNNIISAPDGLRESLRTLTRMQLIRTLAAWRPDLSDYRNLTSAYRIALKSLGRRYLELHDEIADLDAMIAALVEELAPELIAQNSIGYESASQLGGTGLQHGQSPPENAAGRHRRGADLDGLASAGGQHGDQDAGRGRMEDEEAWRGLPPPMAQGPPRDRRVHARDPGHGSDRQQCR